MVWLVIFVALMIPLTAVILDSPVMRAWVDRRHGAAGALPASVQELGEKVQVLEAELEAVNKQLHTLQEEHQFMQRLLEDPAARQAATRLPKPGPGA